MFVSVAIRTDLAALGRHTRFHAMRLFMPVVVGVLVMLSLSLVSAQGGGVAGRAAYRDASRLLAYLVCLAAPWWAATSLAREREERTLPMLELAGVPAWAVVLGHLGAPLAGS